MIRLCLNPDTQSLLLVEDRAQSIYGNKRSYVKETGLDFRGRSKILNINYRNTAQIVSLAWDFYEKYATPQKKSQQEGEGVEIISPKSTKRKGPEAAILRFDSIEEEMSVVAKQIVNFHEEKKIPYSEIAILYRANVKNMVNRIKKVLEEWNIPFNWIAENNATKRNFNPEEQTVKIITIDSSKGLDFQSVFLVKADLLPFPKEKDKERDVSLMYIGMTRSKEYLCITYSGESDYTAYFNEMRQREANSNLMNK
ncbi:3'-5' exonuclease [Bacillus atrophaeus]|uniref:3'-5' exonuclease n=1 Tax=Bacillus atrophaeus TaxID=1452 RepID=UPI0028F6C79A|nr:3'-5' exonuclease [Bacillus atrophaeus]WNV79729.1 3'-5' exonuclease [Bacillus atrophaeus]